MRCAPVLNQAVEGTAKRLEPPTTLVHSSILLPQERAAKVDLVSEPNRNSTFPSLRTVAQFPEGKADVADEHRRATRSDHGELSKSIRPEPSSSGLIYTDRSVDT